MRISEYFEKDIVYKEGYFENLGLCISELNNTLTFLEDEKYLDDINNNQNITSLICTHKIFSKIKRKDIGIILVDNPRYRFFELHNHLNKYQLKQNIISNTAIISPKAIIGDSNIYIGDNVVIKDYVVIKDSCKIHDNVIINEGCVIGNEGFEFKKYKDKILKVNHYGKVVIEENVELKEYVTIHKSLFDWDSTKISKYCKLDTHTHIAHGTKIGKRVLIGAHTNIAGNVKIEDDVRIGPNVTISNRIKIGKNAKLTIGSVITKNVGSNKIVSGNFAINHNKYIEHIKNISSD